MAILAILALALLAFGSAQELESASSLLVKGRIDASGNDLVTLVLNLPQSRGQAFSFNLSGQIESLSAYDETGKKLDADVKIINGSTAIRLVVPNKYVRMELATDYLTSKTGARWTYNSTYSIDTPLDNFDGEIELPPGAMVRSTNGIQAKGGGATTIEWHYSQVDVGAQINRYVNYQISETDDYTVLYLAGAGLLAALLLLYAAIRLRSGGRKGMPAVHVHQAKRPGEPTKKHSLEGNPAFAAMEETDKEIILELHAQGGKATQARIYQRTHISKSSLSRHLISLEHRGLVKRSSRGINTLVSLTDILK